MYILSIVLLIHAFTYKAKQFYIYMAYCSTDSWYVHQWTKLHSENTRHKQKKVVVLWIAFQRLLPNLFQELRVLYWSVHSTQLSALPPATDPTRIHSNRTSMVGNERLFRFNTPFLFLCPAQEKGELTGLPGKQLWQTVSSITTLSIVLSLPT